MKITWAKSFVALVIPIVLFGVLRSVVQRRVAHEATLALLEKLKLEPNPKLSDVQYLISKGADVNAYNDNGETPLLLAADRNPSIIQYILDQGVNVNTRGKDANTALMIASSEGKVENVRFLLHKGADPNIGIHDIGTALSNVQDSINASHQAHKAPYIPYILIAKMLKAAGAKESNGTKNRER